MKMFCDCGTLMEKIEDKFICPNCGKERVVEEVFDYYTVAIILYEKDSKIVREIKNMLEKGIKKRLKIWNWLLIYTRS